MDDPSSTENPTVQAAGGPVPSDPVTAELRAEFARLEQAEKDARERMRLSMHILDDLDPTRPSARRMIMCAIERAFFALEALDQAVGAFGPSDFFAHQYRFWFAFLAYCLNALATLNSLQARAQRAVLRVPLFADGPELSGYKHRLR
ncbi:hypothetical protein [Pseudomonas sp. HLS-6 TE3448]